MTGLNQVRTAVVQTLTAAGLTAVTAYDGEAKRYDVPVAAVDVAEVTGKPMAMGSYLGQVYDETAGTVRELYGRRLELSLLLEVRAPGAAECETACETAAQAIMSGGLPSGLRLGEQSWEAVTWDKAAKMFLRRGHAAGTAYFTASAEEESGELLEFTLKGVVTT
jgi:hypothetical protein